MIDEIQIMQGDQYPLDLTIDIDGDIVMPKDVKTIEVRIGALRKVYPGDATYSRGTFSFPLTQMETFAMPTGHNKVQVRVALARLPEVIGYDEGTVRVKSSNTREVL